MATTPRPRVRTVHDVLLALALLLLDAGFVLFAAFSLLMRGWGSTLDQPRTGPPPMDWVPVLTFGAIAAGIALLAYALYRGGWSWAPGGQFAAALLLGLATVAGGTEEWTRSHPAPPPAPAPAEQRCVCTSGGGPCECPGG
ncbi:DUF6234 family protein [Streptomyces sp. NPDC020807]|uniref:DUF6234 family protein n=1 Tax=Streptomyces sp. NPDC020807 TaxID=3155119 RepID=UPI0033ECFD20